MALTLGNPTLTTGTRSALAQALDTELESGAGEPTITFNDVGGVGLLVTFALDATDAFTESNGVLTLDVSPAISATASAGSATTPDTWFLFDGDSNEVLQGPITGTGPITSGDTVNLNSLTITVPAS